MTFNKVQMIDLIIKDFMDHKDDVVAHTLMITGSDPIPVELPGPFDGSHTGLAIRRQDLRTTQEEADTMIVQQASMNVLIICYHWRSSL